MYLQSSNESEPETEPQSIFLEGALPHESQILVADSQTTPEGVYNEEVNGNSDEPAVKLIYKIVNNFPAEQKYTDPILVLQVILSSKMTLSLINLDPVNNESGGNASNGASDHEQDEIEYDDDDDGDEEAEVEEIEVDEEEEEEVEVDDDEDQIENVHDVAK